MESKNEPNAGENHLQSQTDAIQPQEVVCILKQPREVTGYNVIGLKEEDNGGATPFKLVSYQTQHLPKSISNDLVIDAVPDYLYNNSTRKVHVVVSTGSGTGLALDFHNSVLQPLLKELGILPEGSSENRPNTKTFALTVTQDSHSVRRFARDITISARGFGGPHIQHTVILLSGDGGTIDLLNSEAPINQVDESDTPLPLVAMLPLGTGNALFHSSHKLAYASSGTPEPSPLVLGLRTLLTGRVAPLPSFRVDFSPGSRTIAYRSSQQDPSSGTNDKLEEHFGAISHVYGAVVASYGFHSQLVWESDTPEYRKHGSKRFGMVAQELLKENHAYHAEVEITPADGSAPQKLDRDQHAYILATIVSNLEKTFTISPSSRPSDGKLRLVHFGAVGGQKAMEIMQQAYNNGNHIGMEWTTEDGKTERVGYDEIQHVKITTLEDDARWRKVCIDGTIVEIPTGGYMEIAKETQAHLQVLLPQPSTQP